MRTDEHNQTVVWLAALVDVLTDGLATARRSGLLWGFWLGP